MLFVVPAHSPAFVTAAAELIRFSVLAGGIAGPLRIRNGGRAGRVCRA